jgi:septum formation protein
MSMPSADWIYLASQSPRRRELLTQIGVGHELLLAGPEEDAEALEVVLPGDTPMVYVQRVTALKLIAARARLARAGGLNHPILCADTTVALGDTILGKPENSDDAKRMLRALSGQTHRVYTAIAIAWGDKTSQACCESRVTFTEMSDEQIADYVARAAAYIARIEGSYSGIMGLPLFETAQALREVGFACNKTS